MFNLFMNIILNNRMEPEKKVADQAVHAFYDAYSRRAEEITSLRQYDRGEKVITPSNIRSLGKSVR